MTTKAPPKKRLLHIGCGQAQRADTHHFFHDESWEHVRVDLDPSCEPDVIDDIVKLSKFENDSAEGIFSSHNLEHLHIWDAVAALKRFSDVLRPHGILVIYVPDLRAAMKHALEYDLDSALYQSPAGPITPLDMFYGHINQTWGNEFMKHKCGFTRPFLQRMVISSSGFTNFQITENNFQLELFARKSPRIERDYCR